MTLKVRFLNSPAVPGVRQALSRQGMGWPEFRSTTYKVVAASVVVLEQVFGELVADIFSLEEGPESGEQDTEESDSGLAALVPAANVELVLEHDEELEAVGELFSAGAGFRPR